MRIPLTDDALQALVLGLYEPGSVAHDVTYDRIGMSFSFGGIPVALELKKTDSRPDGNTVENTVYESYTGPVDPESEDGNVGQRSIAPTEDNVERYLYYAFKTVLDGVRQISQPYEFQTYSVASDGRQTRSAANHNFIGAGHRYRRHEEADAVGFDVSGEMFWCYPITHQSGTDGSVKVARFAVSKSQPEAVFGGDGFNPLTEPAIATIDNPSNLVREMRAASKLLNFSVTAVTVDEMDSEGQSSLSAFIGESDELQFEESHDALV